MAEAETSNRERVQRQINALDRETEVHVDSTQFLSFMLGDEIYAIDIAKVREVLDFTSVTRVPQTPRFMKGVINLRGGVVPVVDMRAKFNMPSTEKTVNTCIIIVEVELDGEATYIGAIADSVQEVVDIANNAIEPSPRLGSRISAEFIKGMGRQDDRFLLILDIDRVFSVDELASHEHDAPHPEDAKKKAAAAPGETADPETATETGTEAE